MPLWLNVIILFLIGFILIFIEVVIIPGFGFTGILGTLALGWACYLAFTTLSPVLAAVITLVSIAVLFLLFKIFPKTLFWQKTRLSLTQRKNMGYEVTIPGLENLMHKTGIALTMLRPSGTALIENKHYDVTTDSEFIEKDEKIIVSAIEGNKIIVKKAS